MELHARVTVLQVASVFTRLSEHETGTKIGTAKCDNMILRLEKRSY